MFKVIKARKICHPLCQCCTLEKLASEMDGDQAGVPVLFHRTPAGAFAKKSANSMQAKLSGRQTSPQDKFSC